MLVFVALLFLNQEGFVDSLYFYLFGNKPSWFGSFNLNSNKNIILASASRERTLLWG